MSITVTVPKGGESWEAGTTQTIQWNYTGDPGTTVNLELLRGGTVVNAIASSAPVGTAGKGSYAWNIPQDQTQGSDYKVRVKSTGTPSYTGTSDGNFTITAPGISVVTPNGGESWQDGTARIIRWSYTGNPGATVNIELLKGGSVAAVIASSVSMGSSGSGSYLWNIAKNQTAGDDYRIRVTSAANAAYTDASDSNFTITGAETEIVLTSPNGGETWARGSGQTIRWTYTGEPGAAVKLELLKAEEVVAIIASGVDLGTNGSGSHACTVPKTQLPGSDYKVRITSTSDGSYADTSDAAFSIMPPGNPAILLLLNGGAE